MLIIYETRSFAEARTFESLTRVIYGATAVFVMLYMGIPIGSTIGIIVFSVFILLLVILLISLYVQINRERLKLRTLRINIEKKQIKFIHIPWAYKFKNIKAFYTPESKVHIDLIIDNRQFRIWKSDFEENSELFGEFIDRLDDTNTRSNVPISEISYSSVRKKAFLYLLLPYGLLFYLILTLFPQVFSYLLEENELFLLCIFLGVFFITLAARIRFNIKIKQLLKKETIKEA